MRVYEFSKKVGVTSRDLLDALQQAGFQVGSHMAVLTDKEVEFLDRQFGKKDSKKISQEHVAAKQEAAPVKQEVPTQEVKVSVSPAKTSSVPVSEAASTIQHPHAAHRARQAHVLAPQEPLPLVIQAMTVGRIALALRQEVTAVILTLLKWGIVAAKNQLLKEEVVARLAAHYEVPVVKTDAKDKELEQVHAGRISSTAEHLELRHPVVVVVGHVDHGKTTLLDFIRKTRVAAREKGGITQHLGAYEAATPHGNIVFIDTPGHEAFSKIRMRGVKVADLVILVVAADDGVMPQTVEAIKHAKAMKVPIIAAINKVDKVEPARIEQVKQELSRHDLLPEEWGGDVVVAPISAKAGTGIDHLLEMIILQSQLMELKADVKGPARGYVLESKLEKGRGPVATVLAQHGTVSVGDFFVCGATVGRVNSLIDSHGVRVNSAGPSIPVRVAGFSELPEAGDYFEVVSRERYLEAKSNGPGLTKTSVLPLAGSFEKEGVINIIVKTDTNSSKEALLGSIHKLSKKFEKKFNIINAAIGDVSESDVSLAVTTGASIVGLHIKTGSNAGVLAQKMGVTIELFDIIYKLLEHLEEVAENAKDVVMVKEKTGEAVVRRVFDIKGLGVIAGCYVKDGRITRDGSVVVWRGNKKIGQGSIKSLQREKKMIKEVHAGYECGFIVDGFTDFAIDDRVEAFIEVEKK